MRSVVVTGSSRGIGHQIAITLAQRGWNVGVHFSRDSEGAEALAHSLGDKCFGVFQADLADPSQAELLVESVWRERPVQAWVNNAGVYRQEDLLVADDAFESTWRELMAVNLESPLRLTRELGKRFRNTSGGKILNVASRVGFRGEPGAAIYAATKAGLINLTRSLAVEWAPFGIGVFGIAPGWVETAMVREGMRNRLPSILPTIPLGRMATPEDCAATAAFLLSDEAAYLSGVVIDINGASYFH